MWHDLDRDDQPSLHSFVTGVRYKDDSRARQEECSGINSRVRGIGNVALLKEVSVVVVFSIRNNKQ